ncbi:MAG TPA: aminomethyltransferase family protein [bacterium]|nr:aminomethyltransferase family protein [bacterium]
MQTAQSRLYDYRLVHSARFQKSPLFPIFRRLGANSFLVYNHLLHAVDFDGQTKEQEYWAIRNGVTLWDVSVERPVEINGPDGFMLMDLLTPRDMSKCRIGQGKYAIFCDDSGGIVDDAVVLRLDENRFWLCPADSDLHLWAKGVAVGMGLQATVRLTDVYPIQLQGPKSPDLLRELVGDRILTLPYYWFLEATLGERIPTIISRTGWTGEVGFEVYLLDNSYAEEMIDLIVETGKPFGLIPAGPNHPRRVEAGILNYQSDMNLETNPYELGLDYQVDLSKARFIGKDALSRVRREGLRRKLVGLEIEGEPVPIEFEGAWPVFKDGRPIGRASAVLYSPSLKRNIALAMVGIEHSAQGQAVEVQRYPEERRHTARVVPLPFVDPKKEIPKRRLDAAGRA